VEAVLLLFLLMPHVVPLLLQLLLLLLLLLLPLKQEQHHSIRQHHRVHALLQRHSDECALLVQNGCYMILIQAVMLGPGSTGL
jgi:hypothetical protein